MSRTRDDSGFSLIELTIAVSILGLVMAAVTTTMLVSLRATAEATDRLDRGNDVLLTTALFSPDVAGASEVTAPGQAGTPGSPTAAECGPTNDGLIVEFRGQTTLDIRDDQPWTVSYVLSDGGATLTRQACTGASAKPHSELVVSGGLSASTGPTVRCRDDRSTVVACGEPATRVVTLDLTGADGTARAATGTRRTT